MAIPGFFKTTASSRATAAVPLAILLCIGCGNPFTDFYSGGTITDMRSAGWRVEPPRDAPKVMLVSGDTYEQVIRQHCEDGWMDFGSSTWIDRRIGTSSDARQQAARVGAELVIWTYEYKGMSTASVPATTPTVSTSTASGTVGSAGWSGTATTYGTQTAMVNVPQYHYLMKARYLCRNLETPAFGIVGRRMTADEQKRAGTIEGLVVMLVIRGTPAARAGLLPDDVITRIGNYEITDREAYRSATEALRGQSVEVVWIRQGSTVTKQIRLASEDASSLSPYRSRASTELSEVP